MEEKAGTFVKKKLLFIKRREGYKHRASRDCYGIDEIIFPEKRKLFSTGYEGSFV